MKRLGVNEIVSIDYFYKKFDWVRVGGDKEFRVGFIIIISNGGVGDSGEGGNSIIK